MASIADQMLAASCLPNLDSLHAEWVKVLGGSKAGQSFLARHETKADEILLTGLGPDPRAKDVLYFSLPGPDLEQNTVVQTEDGRKWKSTRQEQSAYLEQEYDIVEMVKGKDK